ncbi:uncharacterized protein PFL1_03775 [Pseudozyma flocculosa PF-1]|nr:uncharacterized protein PFL1_03775 [Pseudozyma flocculosa PF-1]EPQ28472.1 hypothetical protein PFL1_03775 [Pseudozyma flocculosa PF-1]
MTASLMVAGAGSRSRPPSRLASSSRTASTTSSALTSATAAASAASPPHLSDGPFDPYNCITSRLPTTASAGDAARTPRDGRPLAGWDVAVKENICVLGAATTCSSRMLSDYASTFDAACVHRLRNAGATIAAKTNCDEFGMGSENVHSFHGPVRNPAKAVRDAAPRPEPAAAAAWDLERERVAGGSSGGSAAAVKAGLARIAIGTDTGGSIRLPAAYCGVVGLKPSYGLVSRWGLVSYADSLDTVGVLGSGIDDVEAAFDVLSAPDARDPTCVDASARRRAEGAVAAALDVASSSTTNGGGVVEGLRIGIPREYFPRELHPRVLAPFRAAVHRLREQGAHIVSVSLPTTPYALSAYYVISSAEASSNLARYDGVEYGYRASAVEGQSPQQEQQHPYARTRSQGFGAEVQRRILLGTYALSADKFDNYFLQAGRIRREIQRDFATSLRIPSVLGHGVAASPLSADKDKDGVDVLLHPSAVDTAPTLASALGFGPRAGTAQERQDRILSSYVQDVLTVPASLAGLPAISLPVGEAEDDGWPVGVTATSQWGCEKILFRIGRALAL